MTALLTSLSYAVDTDSDGMDDVWEQQVIDADVGDSITAIAHVLPGDDFDGDSYSNLSEHDGGTNPVIPSNFYLSDYLIHAIGNQSLALDTDGMLKVWGLDNLGQAGNGTAAGPNTPNTVLTSGVISTSSSGNHVLVLLDDGTVKAWGYNNNGQVGNGTSSNQTSPVDLTFTGLGTGETIAAVYARGSLSLAIDSGRALWAWGQDNLGQVGNGSTAGPNSPAEILSSGVESVSSSGNHVLALMDDGTVKGWGYNNAGQVGNGTATNQTSPVNLTFSGLGTGEEVVALFAAGNQSLAVDSSGGLWSWGYDALGQAGNGSSGASTTPQEVISSGVVNVSSSGNHVLALLDDGTVKAWGYNNKGQVGNGTYTNQISPVSLTFSGLGSGETIVSVHAAGNQSLAVDSAGGLWVWGDDTLGQSGNGTSAGSTTPIRIISSAVQTVSTSGQHVLALLDDGAVEAWGYNINGQVGNGTSTNQTSPVVLVGIDLILSGVFLEDDLGNEIEQPSVYENAQTGDVLAIVTGVDAAQQPLTFQWLTDASGKFEVVDNAGTDELRVKSGVSFDFVTQNTYSITIEMVDGSSNVYSRTYAVDVKMELDTSLDIQVQLDASSLTSFAVDDIGAIWAWGYNNYGTVGDGTTTNRTTPVKVLSEGVAELSAGDNHVLVLKDDGTVWGWGYNAYGQAADGTTTNRNTPAQISGLADVVEVATTANSSFALDINGAVWGWGRNNYGTVGDGTTTNRTAPVQVLTGAVVKLSGGDNHVLALKEDGTVWGWGYNTYGQAADGTTTNRKTPAQISGLTGIVEVATTANSSFALDVNGAVWGWGRNNYGTVGDGTTTNRTAPVQVLTGGVVKLSGGDNHVLALKDDGTVWGWGYNAYGQVADGTTTNRKTPAQISGLTGIVEVATTANSSFAVDDAGEVWAWGYNNYGAVGDGTTTNRTTPVQVLTGEVVQLSGGDNHLLAFEEDGTIWTWGYNTYGQAGDGTTTNRKTPGTLSSLVFNPDTVPLIITSGLTDGVTGETYLQQLEAVGGNGTLTWEIVNGGLPAGLTLSTSGLISGTPTQAETAVVEISVSEEAGFQDSDRRVFELTVSSAPVAPSAPTLLVADVISSYQIKLNWQDNSDGEDGFAIERSDDGVNYTEVVAVDSNVSSYVDLGVLSGSTYYYRVRAYVSGVYSGYSAVVSPTTLGIDIAQRSLELGYDTSYAVDAEGGVWSWGRSDYGQVGDGGTADVTNPKKVVDQAVSSVVASKKSYHVLALKTDGTVLAWGRNNFGQLGIGNTSNQLEPVVISGLSDVIGIELGYTTSYAIDSDGHIWAWGQNEYGQVGNGNTTNQSSPVEVYTGSAQQIKASHGHYHVLALKADGTVLAWGRNNYGQLGDGTTTNRNTPALISSLSGIVAIEAGYTSSYAIDSDGDVWAWGLNDKGQLGDGTTSNRSTPVEVIEDEILKVSVSKGHYHVLALKADGTVLAWGRNNYGQLGDSTTTNRSAPVQVSSLAGIIDVEASYGSSYALDNAGNVWSWGFNEDGQLGNGTTTNQSVPQKVVNGGAVEIRSANGGYHVLVRLADGSLLAFGRNDDGQLGNGSKTDQDEAVWLPGVNLGVEMGINTFEMPDVIDQVAYSYTLLASNGAAPYTWSLESGTLPAGLSLSSAGVISGTVTVGSTVDLSRSVPTNSFTVKVTDNEGKVDRHVFSISIRSDESVSILPVNEVISWPSVFSHEYQFETTSGNAPVTWTYSGALPSGLSLSSGGLLQGQTTDTEGRYEITLTATDYNGDTDSIDLAVELYTDRIDTAGAWLAPGANFSAALDNEGKVWTWGYNLYGAIGNGTTSNRNTPFEVIGSEIVSLAAGDNHTLALKTDGSVWAWGYNTYGQAGDGTTTNRTTPAQVGELPDIVDVRTSSLSSFAIDESGAVWAWGYNVYGTVGDGTKTNRSDPKLVLDSGVVTLSGGDNHVLALKADGTVWAWGYNAYGQVGDGTTVNRDTPWQVGGLSEIEEVITSNNSSYALDRYGALWAWGYNNYGSIGDGTTSDRSAPIKIVEAGVVSVKAGDNHVLILKDDGTVWAWGYNAYGQVGDSTTTNRKVPVKINGLSDIVQVGVTGFSAFAIDNSGKTWGWGYNNYGTVGNGTTVNQTSPVVIFSSNVAAMHGGDNHSLALKVDGTVWAWGYNVYGQVGNGTTSNQTSPVQVTGLDLFPDPFISDPSSLPAVTQGDSYSYTFESLGGSGSYTWSELTSLPTGLSLNTSTGVISGTPATSGAYWFDIQVSDGTDTVSQSFSLVVEGDSTPTIDTTALPEAQLHRFYEYELAASSGNGDLSWSLAGGSGALPGGFALSSAGVITGTATQSGSYSLLIDVTDRDGDTDQLSVSLLVAQQPPSDVTLTGTHLFMESRLTPQITSSNQEFGGVMDFDGEHLAIAHPSESSSSGVVTLYRKEGADFVQTVRLEPDELESNDEFGSALAVDGDWLAIGAPKDDDLGTDHGAVYLYQWSSSLNRWELNTKLLENSMEGQAAPRFGASVALYGEWLVVGAPYYDGQATDSGEVFVYRLESGQWTFNKQLSSSAHETASDLFGSAVSVHGGWLVVGAPGNDDGGANTGSIYQYEWKYNSGAGAFVWDYVTRSDNPDTQANAGYAEVLALNDYYLLVGAPQGDDATNGTNSGVVYGYTLGSSNWTYDTDYKAPDGAASDNFAASVALDEERILIGAPLSDARGTNSGRVYRFDNQGAWVESFEWGETGEEFGSQVLLHGDVMLFSAPQSDIFNTNLGYVSVLENGLVLSDTAAVATVVATVSGVDPEGDTLTYSLVDDDSGRFELFDNSGTIELRVATGASFDFDLQNIHQVTIQADDGNGGTLDQVFNIYLITDAVIMEGLLAAGLDFSVAVKSDGTVWTWGANTYGQLGDGTFVDSDSPAQVTGLSEISRVAAGDAHVLALQRDGQVMVWGANDSGQLGDGTTTDSNTPLLNSTLSGITALAAGKAHSLALDQNNDVWTWGDGAQGQLGHGTPLQDESTPLKVANLDSLTVTAVAAGGDHSLALVGGNVYAWGDNLYGQLGNGTTTDASTPVQLSPSSPYTPVFVAVAAGEKHSLALDDQGAVWSWGENADGQLGHDDTTDRTSPTLIAHSALTDIVGIAAGSNYSLALRSDGTVWSWGDNTDSQLGNSTDADSQVPTQVALPDGVLGITAGGTHAQAVSSDGLVWSWGNNADGQLGDLGFENKSTPVITGGLILETEPEVVTASIPKVISDQAYSVTMAANGGFTPYQWDVVSGTLPDGLSLNASTGEISGTVLAAEAGSYQISIEVTDARDQVDVRVLDAFEVEADTVPVITEDSIPDMKVGEEATHVFALTDGNADFIWTLDGSSDSLPSGVILSSAGVLVGTPTESGGSPYGLVVKVTDADGDTDTYSVDLTVASAEIMPSLTGGKNFSVVLDDKGSLSTWGSDNNGQLGTGGVGDASQTSPVSVSSPTGLRTISRGYHFALAVDPDQKVWGWGDNTNGQLGQNNNTDQGAPVKVQTGSGDLTDVASAAAGYYHSLFLKSDGTVYSAGFNNYGQLGNNTTTASTLPVQVGSGVTGFENIVDVAGGDYFSLFLKEDGTVWGTGWNGSGALGDGSYTSRTQPVQTGSGITGFEDIVELVAGGAHGLALKGDGSVWGWGYNSLGGVGDGSATLRTSPVQVGVGVSGFSDIIAVAGGEYHSLALKSDGTVWAWGWNYYGEIGDGTTTQRNSPVEVSAVNFTGPVIAIGAGLNHSLAMTADGKVWAWGANTSSQLGDASTTNRNAPVAVGSLLLYTDLTIQTGSLAPATTGAAYSQDLDAQGPGPYTWSLASGSDALPTGLSLSGSTISGTPTAISTANLILEVTNGTDTVSKAFTLEVTAPLADAPTALQVTATADDEISLSWTDNASNETGFVVEQSTNGTDFTAITTTSANTSTYTDTGLTESTQYFYRVKAVNSGGESAASNTVNDWTTSTAVPDAPSDLQVAQTIHAGELFLIWQDNASNEREFIIERQSELDLTWVEVTRVDANIVTYTDTGLTGGFEYTYRITASNTTGDSAASDTVTAIPLIDDLLGIGVHYGLSGAQGYALALANDGIVHAWGHNTYGSLASGNDADYDRLEPATVDGVSDIISVTSKGEHTLALNRDGILWTWGRAENGRLGLGSSVTEDQTSPQQITTLGRVTAIGSGRHHSLAITDNDAVWTWGQDNSGSLAPNNNGDLWQPQQVLGSTTLGSLVAVDGGLDFSLLLTEAGELYSWGVNTAGQLGHGTTTATSDLTLLDDSTGLSFVAMVSAGESYVLAIDDSGDLWAWGDNTSGQLGDNSTTDRTAPVQVTAASGSDFGQQDITLIAAGTSHSLALDAAGSLWAWGENADGQLGDDSTADALQPVQVDTSAMTGTIIDLAAGPDFSLALTDDGTLWAWGANDHGQLGSGSTADSLTPQAITNLNLMPTLADTDQDGVPDTWEAEQGLASLNPWDATADDDNDGLSNATEYLNGTDPNSASSGGVALETGDAWLQNQQFGYDSYGNITTKTDPNGVTTTLTYDSTYATFIEGQSKGGYSSSTTYDKRSGQILEVTDTKGLKASKEHDAFYRLKKAYTATTASSTPSLLQTEIEYNIGGISGGVSQNYIKQTSLVKGGNGTGGLTYVDSYAYVDGTGQTIQTREQAETGNFRVTSTIYNNAGQILHTTLPYFESGTANTTVSTSNPPIGVTKAYDPLGRIISETPPPSDTGSPTAATVVEFTQNGDPWASKSTDPTGVVAKAYRDGKDRMVRTETLATSGTVSTDYTYDVLGNLVKVTDGAGNEIDVVYDNLGRKTSMTEGNLGTWTYEYDAVGRLVEQKDNKGNRIVLEYNESALKRLSAKKIYDHTDTLEATYTYEYDTGETGYTVYPGQLFKITDAEGWQKFSYDIRGRVIKQTRYLNKTAKEYTTQLGYDDADNVIEAVYPDDLATLAYDYDSIGQMETVRSTDGTGINETFFDNPVFNAEGQLTQFTYGTGAVNTHEYYTNSKRLKALKVTDPVNSGYLQNLSYTYDAANNIGSITDAVNTTGAASQTISATGYDDLHRLTSTTSVAKGQVNYAYDNAGNMTSNGELPSGSQAYTYGSSRPHAVTSANGKTYTYDANGNMTGRGADQTLTYDAQNRLVRFVETSPGTSTVIKDISFGYAEDGTRLWKDDGTTVTVWIGETYEKKGGKELLHVFAGDRRIATFEPDSGGMSSFFGLGEESLVAQAEIQTGEFISWATRGTPYAMMLCLIPLSFLGLGLLLGRAPPAWILILMPAAWPKMLSRKLLVATGGRLVRSQELEVRSQHEESATATGASNLLTPDSGLLSSASHLLSSLKNWLTTIEAPCIPIYKQAICTVLIVASFFSTSMSTWAGTGPDYDPVFYYYHGDHLGSSSVMTDRDGDLVQRYGYSAYGNEIHRDNSSAFELNNRFTGQVFDQDTGLYYMKARYYDSEIGRFISPDTIIPDPADSQTYNRYSYGYNNPLKYTDPTGHFGFIVGLIVAVVVAAAVGAVVGAVSAAITGGNIWQGALTGAISGVFSGAGGFVGGPVGAYVGSVVGAGVNAAILGQNIGEAIAVTAISGAVGMGVGHLTGNLLKNISSHLARDIVSGVSSVATGALTGGVTSVAMGGSFSDGLVYGAIGSAVAVGANIGTKYAAEAIKSGIAKYQQSQEARIATGNSNNSLGDELSGSGPNSSKQAVVKPVFDVEEDFGLGEIRPSKKGRTFPMGVRDEGQFKTIARKIMFTAEAEDGTIFGVKGSSISGKPHSGEPLASDFDIDAFIVNDKLFNDTVNKGGHLRSNGFLSVGATKHTHQGLASTEIQIKVMLGRKFTIRIYSEEQYGSKVILDDHIAVPKE